MTPITPHPFYPFIADTPLYSDPSRVTCFGVDSPFYRQGPIQGAHPSFYPLTPNEAPSPREPTDPIEYMTSSYVDVYRKQQLLRLKAEEETRQAAARMLLDAGKSVVAQKAQMLLPSLLNTSNATVTGHITREGMRILYPPGTPFFNERLQPVTISEEQAGQSDQWITVDVTTSPRVIQKQIVPIETLIPRFETLVTNQVCLVHLRLSYPPYNNVFARCENLEGMPTNLSGTFPDFGGISSRITWDKKDENILRIVIMDPNKLPRQKVAVCRMFPNSSEKEYCGVGYEIPGISYRIEQSDQTG